MKGLQTSGTGWLALVAIVGGVLNQLFDSDPLTNPDWNYVLPMILASFGVARSRANNQSSEDVGIKK